MRIDSEHTGLPGNEPPTGISAEQIRRHYDMGLYNPKVRRSPQRDSDDNNNGQDTPTGSTQKGFSISSIQRLSELGMLKPKK